TPGFPEVDFQGPQDLLLRILASQGIVFSEVLIDRSFADEGLDTRKPGVGMLRHWLADDGWSRARSARVGDSQTDLQLAANLGVRGFRVGACGQTWAAIAHDLLDAPRIAEVIRETRETKIRVRVDLDAGAGADIHSGLGFFDHMLEQIARHASID